MQSMQPGTQAPACVMTLFGVTGDLAKRLLFPSLYNLASSKSLSSDFRLLGVGRRDWQDDTLREHLTKSLQEFLGAEPDAAIVRWLTDRTSYQKTELDDQASFKELQRRIKTVGGTAAGNPNKLFYFSLAPNLITGTILHLSEAELLGETESAWSRVIIEKPFGHDLTSAKELNEFLLQHLKESQIYRIDHFAGKDTVQDLAVFRFSNAVIEPLWHRSLIDSVQITASETVGLEGRAEFYEESGALRDMVPNHLAELLSLVAMEPPVSFSVEHMRAKQVELLESVRRLKPDEVPQHAVRGQYAAGTVGDKARGAYLQEKGVAPQSTTETYAALKVEIDNWRWSGVPFFLRTGKSLAKSVTEIAVQFRVAPARLFPNIAQCTAAPNQVVFEMKPRQGIDLNFCARAPGLDTRVMGGAMSFEFPDGPYGKKAKGYERLLRDAMLGDPILFASARFVEEGWRLIQPVLDSWKTDNAKPLPQYAAGSEGPDEADALLAHTGHRWRPLV